MKIAYTRISNCMQQSCQIKLDTPNQINWGDEHSVYCMQRIPVKRIGTKQSVREEDSSICSIIYSFAGSESDLYSGVLKCQFSTEFGVFVRMF